MQNWMWTSAAIAGVALLGACAQTQTAENAAPTPPSAQAQPQQPGTFTDGQLRSFAAARAEIEPISATYESLTPEQRTQATAHIVAIQQRHGLDATTYAAIASAARNDQALANRLASLQGFTDAQVQSFAAASLEIDPINRQLATATPEQRAQAAEQIRAILARHNLDGATYNAIATAAQTDQTLAARIAAAQAAQPAAQQPPQGE